MVHVQTEPQVCFYGLLMRSAGATGANQDKLRKKV